MSSNTDVVVFSHLRWEFVYQRPQHVLSRLAAYRRVTFVEEPFYSEGAGPMWEVRRSAANVRVMRPILPVDAAGFDDQALPLLLPMVRHLCAAERHHDCVAWLYTPMAMPLARAIEPRLLVYDCMDELSAFMHAPPLLLARERELLAAADLVFTGGPSLYRAKQRQSASVHCFPSSVDAAHFRAARDRSIEAQDQAGIPGPRLGFYGVIDERIDLDLLDSLAASHPEWQIVMVGPVVKIDPETLPRRPNIHYLGQRDYADLPAYLAGWDVCLQPFALNEATRFISPTKTLEYMAAERPIVSTPITDVAEPYGDIVLLGDTPSAFIQACERALALTPAERDAMVARMRRVVSATSWDKTAQAMDSLIERALAAQGQRPRRPAAVPQRPAAASPATAALSRGEQGG